MWSRIGRVALKRRGPEAVRHLSRNSRRWYTLDPQNASTPATPSTFWRGGWFAFGAATATVASYYMAHFPVHKEKSTRTLQEPKLNTSRETIQEAFRELQTILPQGHVTVDETVLKEHGYSNNSYHNEGVPNIVVYPRSTEEVASIVKIANRLR